MNVNIILVLTFYKKFMTQDTSNQFFVYIVYTTYIICKIPFDMVHPLKMVLSD